MSLLSVVFFFSNHPLILGMLLILMSVVVSMNLFLLLGLAWLSYVVVLVFLGGVLVLFIYMASLASNEDFDINSSYILVFLLLLGFMGSWFYFNQEFYMWKLYLFFPFSFVIIFLGFYLLMSLIVVVKISCVEEGPLREVS
uniref:NADH dehydrogenase subunit 6 n=1 Tax=Tityus serrulatus TaxID=6887 RepID=A0A0K1LWE9_TITSE|nr:NADH dehydrogenase subunit 6 [Tityus serrulatus]AKU46799.1 NADH dehydrogenase subunit 6 [Tityus serrulatus]